MGMDKVDTRMIQMKLRLWCHDIATVMLEDVAEYQVPLLCEIDFRPADASTPQFRSHTTDFVSGILTGGLLTNGRGDARAAVTAGVERPNLADAIGVGKI
ncbi:hypothetical protein M8C21_027125 [Ambrosia artemisiifolia]|uniref:Uncharacterized protein n=1 Tax=Ambrosia artemisiifolia TaxID=4212 RepID=A0AAD5CBQ6_AMBAR|nr:hypothetical protein M8C21_027125 [Ambrosia artemisiifolia]